MPDIDALIAEGLRLREAATDKGWWVEPNRPHIVCSCHINQDIAYCEISEHDADFIAFAGTHVRTLLLALAAERRQREEWGDETLATPEFCESLGLQDTSGFRNMKVYQVGPNYVRFNACEGPLCWRTETTRGQLRHLLAALKAKGNQ